MTRDGAATDPIARALWFIESHFSHEITLDDVAAVAGVSRYHLSRTFGLATGSGLMAYVRSRRLSEAAKALAAGPPDILAVAMRYVTGAPSGFDATGLRFEGDADYGALGTDGTRQAGSDFNDYLGTTVTYASGTVDPPFKTFQTFPISTGA